MREQTLGCARLVEHVFYGLRAQHHIRCMFEQTHIAGGDGRRSEAEDLPERKVPRHHGEHDTQGLIHDATACSITLNQFISEKRRAMFGVEATDPGTFFDLGAGLTDELPHLQGDQARQLIAPLIELICHSKQQRTTLVVWRLRPSRGTSVCHRDRAFDLLGIERGCRSHLPAVEGVDRFKYVTMIGHRNSPSADPWPATLIDRLRSRYPRCCMSDALLPERSLSAHRIANAAACCHCVAI